MSDIELPKHIVEEILRCEVGSTAHGVSVSGIDDLDMLGIGIESPEYVFGLHHFEHFVYRTAAIRDGKPDAPSQPGDIDLTVYSLRKFAQLCAKGNPTILMLLFAPVMKQTGLGAILRANADKFKSRRAGSAFLGYMTAQRRKLENGANPSHGKREHLVKQYGFDTKFAMHMLRLGFQGIEFMETGNITLPMANERPYLLKVREGLFSQESCLRMSQHLEEQLKKSIDHSPLPKDPDERGIATLVQGIYTSAWRKAGLL